MKRTWIYALLLAAALAVPAEQVKLGQMKPVETVYLHMEDGQVTIETDTKDRGIGKSADDALANLKETTAGIIYLDTARYLLVEKGAEGMIGEMSNHLKEDTMLCYVEGEPDLEMIGSYLNTNRPRVSVEEWREGIELEMLSITGERMILK